MLGEQQAEGGGRDIVRTIIQRPGRPDLWGGSSGGGGGLGGDGSGVFAGTGPLTWDLASGAGVCWKTALPPSSSSPVMVGDGVLTLAEPDEVVCLAAADGAAPGPAVRSQGQEAGQARG